MKLRVLTGLHIGGNNDGMKIGGIDSEVVKREVFIYKDSGKICYTPEFEENEDLKEGIEKIEEPYIPGSSLKGKVRSLLEHSFGLYKNLAKEYKSKWEDLFKILKQYNITSFNKFKKLEKDKKLEDKIIKLKEYSEFKEIEKIFGEVISSKHLKYFNEKAKKLAQLIIELFGESAGNENRGFQVTRVIFRDAFITKDIRKAFIEGKIDLSEEKAENTINRVTSMANPRFMERVPAGVEFEVDYVIRDFLDDEDRIKLYEDTIELGLLLLQNDALGGGGSRGNGRISFDIFDGVENIKEEIKNRMDKIKAKL